MSIPFVDREPEKQEIEHLRQLLGRYAQVNSLFLFNLDRNRIKEIIAEAFGISSNKLYDSDLKYKIEITSPFFSENGLPVKMEKCPYPTYWEYLSEFNVNIDNYRENPYILGVASVDLLYKSDSNLDLSKSSFLYLDIGQNGGQLSQYSYFVDPRKLRWFFDEVPYEYGDEYREFLDKRELVIDSQQDFVGRRAIDGFWDIIEIKRSLN